MLNLKMCHWLIVCSKWSGPINKSRNYLTFPEMIHSFCDTLKKFWMPSFMKWTLTFIGLPFFSILFAANSQSLTHPTLKNSMMHIKSCLGLCYAGDGLRRWQQNWLLISRLTFMHRHCFRVERVMGETDGNPSWWMSHPTLSKPWPSNCLVLSLMQERLSGFFPI